MVPIFPGASEADQIHKICSVLGTPKKEEWEEGFKLAAQISFKFHQFLPVPMQSLIPNASPDAINMIASMLQYNPLKVLVYFYKLKLPYIQ